MRHPQLEGGVQVSRGQPALEHCRLADDGGQGLVDRDPQHAERAPAEHVPRAHAVRMQGVAAAEHHCPLLLEAAAGQTLLEGYRQPAALYD